MARPVVFGVRLLCCLQYYCAPVSALDDEFDGLSHFKGWDGDLVNLMSWNITGACKDGHCLGSETFKALCNANTDCLAFTPRGAGGFRSLRSGTGYDTYLAWNKTTVPGAACTTESGGCTDPTSKWLSCPGGDWLADGRIIATYNLPPGQLHEP
jgi:hypothetical protein